MGSVLVREGVARRIADRRLLHVYACGKCGCDRIIEHSAAMRNSLCRACWHSRGHAISKEPLYGMWKSMVQRCQNPNIMHYRSYGGRGIRVCDQWKNDFWSFKRWCESNGYADGLQIDRINVDGDYTPWNCRWATSRENSRNRRSSKLTKSDIPVIRMLCWSGLSCTQVSKIFSVTPNMISQIMRRKTWSDV